MSKITLKVNGRTHTLDVEPATPLLYILRNDLGLQGPAVWMRTWPVRRVHGDHQRRGGSFLHHACVFRQG